MRRLERFVAGLLLQLPEKEREALLAQAEEAIRQDREEDVRMVDEWVRGLLRDHQHWLQVKRARAGHAEVRALKEEAWRYYQAHTDRFRSPRDAARQLAKGGEINLVPLSFKTLYRHFLDRRKPR